MNKEQTYIEFLGLQHLEKIMKNRMFNPMWSVKTTQLEYVICLVEGSEYQVMYFDGDNDATYHMCHLKSFETKETDTNVLKWVLGDIALNNLTTANKVEILEIERFDGLNLETFEYNETYKLYQKQEEKTEE